MFSFLDKLYLFLQKNYEVLSKYSCKYLFHLSTIFILSFLLPLKYSLFGGPFFLMIPSLQTVHIKGVFEQQ